MLERQKSEYRLTFDFFLPLGATAEMQSPNNGWLFLLGKRWGMEGVLEGFILVMVIGLLVWK